MRRRDWAAPSREPPDLAKRLGANARRIRQAAKLSQEEAAYRCDFATRMLQRIEAGAIDSRLSTVARLCVGLETDAAELLRNPDERTPKRARTMSKRSST
ncbi:MAG: helix-turn-helix transcriptional regulator [Deltaproteobacteria bacterium]|nr:helix-turn-helix transcriptional regulator [Deltaproteobacteria bacterium]